MESKVVVLSLYKNGSIRRVYGPFADYKQAMAWVNFHKKQFVADPMILPMEFGHYHPESAIL